MQYVLFNVPNLGWIQQSMDALGKRIKKKNIIRITFFISKKILKFKYDFYAVTS